jgi:hypothetical protein
MAFPTARCAIDAILNTKACQTRATLGCDVAGESGEGNGQSNWSSRRRRDEETRRKKELCCRWTGMYVLTKGWSFSAEGTIRTRGDGK